MHTKPRAELGGRVAFGDESDSLVEIRGMGIPDDRDAGDTEAFCIGDGIVDQSRGHSLAHPIGVGEQIDELERTMLGDGGRKPTISSVSMVATRTRPPGVIENTNASG